MSGKKDCMKNGHSVKPTPLMKIVGQCLSLPRKGRLQVLRFYGLQVRQGL
jgi:hypothetical protein